MTSSLSPQDRASASSSPSQAYRPIEDYGLIGDMRGCALVSREASVDWLCLRRFDCTPTFFALLDADLGGVCSVRLAGGRPWETTRRYRPNTNILETTLIGAQGRVTVTDFMPVRVKPHPGLAGADSKAAGLLVRRITCISGSVSLRLAIAPRFDWALKSEEPAVTGAAATYPQNELYVTASRPLVEQAGELVIDTVLHDGDTICTVVGHAAVPTGDIDRLVARWLEETEAYWTGWAACCTYSGIHAELVLRSALCLKLLTYAPTGALVAAPTTSLPETVGGVRNWDYRFVWTRDASFTVGAFINLGFDREAAEFLRFLHEADHAGQPLRIMYGVDGDLPDERRLDHLAGWRGSRPVLAGNLAFTQNQFEIYGEILAALNLFLTSCGTEKLYPSLAKDLPAFIKRLADAVIERWREPDHGIWEFRSATTHQLHTKALCWVALDRAVQLAPRVGITAPAEWAANRDAIMADLLENGWNAAKGAYTMSYGTEDLDAAVLRLPLMQVFEADDPRMRATADAIDRDLRVGDDLYYRYRRDDGLPDQEGAFAACTYWAVANRVLTGRLDEARVMLDKGLARANDLGLFPEEFDVESGASLGNFPQAFTHMAVIQETLRLSAALDAE